MSQPRPGKRAARAASERRYACPKCHLTCPESSFTIKGRRGLPDRPSDICSSCRREANNREYHRTYGEVKRLAGAQKADRERTGGRRPKRVVYALPSLAERRQLRAKRLESQSD